MLIYGVWFLFDWELVYYATALVGEGDACQRYVSFTWHSSGPNRETSAQSMEFSGTILFEEAA